MTLKLGLIVPHKFDAEFPFNGFHHKTHAGNERCWLLGMRTPATHSVPMISFMLFLLGDLLGDPLGDLLGDWP